MLGWMQSGQAEESRNQPPGEKPLIETMDGRALFRAYCASCHGEQAKGDGPVSGALKGMVPDLTRISERNGGSFPFVRVEKIISGEENSALAHGSRKMPVWGPFFGQIGRDQDLGKVRIYNLTKYLESIQGKPLIPPTPAGHSLGSSTGTRLSR